MQTTATKTADLSFTAKLPTGLFVLAVLNVMGGLFQSLVIVVDIAVHVVDWRVNMKMLDSPLEWANLFGTVIILFRGTFSLVSGAGLLFHREWARKLTVALCWVILISSVFEISSSIVMVLRKIHFISSSEESNTLIISVVFTCFFGLAGLGYAALLGYWATRPEAKKAMMNGAAREIHKSQFSTSPEENAAVVLSETDVSSSAMILATLNLLAGMILSALVLSFIGTLIVGIILTPNGPYAGQEFNLLHQGEIFNDICYVIEFILTWVTALGLLYRQKWVPPLLVVYGAILLPQAKELLRLSSESGYQWIQHVMGFSIGCYAIALVLYGLNNMFSPRKMKIPN